MEHPNSATGYKLNINATFQDYVEYKCAVWVWKICAPLLIMFGTIGNVLSLLVLVRKRLRSSPTMFFLAALAVVDIMVLYSGLLRLWLENVYSINIRLKSDGACRFHTFFVYFILSFSVWIIVAVTVDRCIIVCAPFKAKSLSSVSKARKTVLVIAITLICFNAHIFFTQTLVAVNYFDKGIKCSHARTGKYFRDYIWPWMDFGVYCVIPFFVMIVCNLLIIRKIAMSARKLKQHNEYELNEHTPKTLKGTNFRIPTVERLSVLALLVSNAVLVHNIQLQDKKARLDSQISSSSHVSLDMSRKLQHKSTSLTVMLLVVSFVFMLLVLPITVYLIGFQVWIVGADAQLEARLHLIWAVVNVLQYTNNSIHFFLYCLTGPRFRAEFVSMFKSCAQKKIEPSVNASKQDKILKIN